MQLKIERIGNKQGLTVYVRPVVNKAKFWNIVKTTA
jgi:hypothetical protein